MRSIAAVVLVLAACGPKAKNEPDPDGPPADSPSDTQVTGCDYTETRDDTNDDVAPATGTPEDTGLTFDQKLVVCGAFDAGHFDGDITVDVDGYLVTFDTAVDVMVRLSGPGAEGIELVGLDVYGGPDFDEVVTTDTFYGDHSAAAIHLPPGTYELLPFALAGEAIEATVDYKITIDTDDPATRCPSEVDGMVYAEANDGAANNGNDMVTIPSGAPPALTAGADSPEPTGLTIATGVLDVSSKHRIGGLLADVAVEDQYEDKDTYLVNSGQANELSIKLEWNSASNLDFLVFEADSAEPVKRAIVASNVGPEYQAFSVKPETAYWVLIGAKTGSAVPTAYSASLCGAAFVP